LSDRVNHAVISNDFQAFLWKVDIKHKHLRTHISLLFGDSTCGFGLCCSTPMNVLSASVESSLIC
jgi:hypothetical protein